MLVRRCVAYSGSSAGSSGNIRAYRAGPIGASMGRLSRDSGRFVLKEHEAIEAVGRVIGLCLRARIRRRLLLRTQSVDARSSFPIQDIASLRMLTVQGEVGRRASRFTSYSCANRRQYNGCDILHLLQTMTAHLLRTVG